MVTVFFPAFLQIARRPCLLIGGTGSAVAKGEGLLAAGAVLTVVAPRLAEPLQILAKDGRLTWVAETFQEQHLESIWLVVSTLQDETLNRHIQAATDRRGLFLNVVDQPAFCSFHWPATLHRPPVTVAFDTGGQAPVLSGYLRRKLEDSLPEEIGALAHWLAAWRTEVALVLPRLENRGQFWRELLAQGVAEQFLSGDSDGATAAVRAALDAHYREHPGSG